MNGEESSTFHTLSLNTDPKENFHTDNDTDCTSETTSCTHILTRDISDRRNSSFESSSSSQESRLHPDQNQARIPNQKTDISEPISESTRIQEDPKTTITINVTQPNPVTKVHDLVGTESASDRSDTTADRDIAQVLTVASRPHHHHQYNRNNNNRGVQKQKVHAGGTGVILAQQHPQQNHKFQPHHPQQRQTDFDERKEELTRELRKEEQRKQEQRARLEQEVQKEEQQRITQENQQRKLEHQRIEQDRKQQQLELERRQQQQLLEHEQQRRINEERQRKELHQRQLLERQRKQREEELRAQRLAREEQFQREKESKTRENQCEFPVSTSIENSTHAQNMTMNMNNVNAMGATQQVNVGANGQHYVQHKRHHGNRTSTMSMSSTDTPMKRPIRNHHNPHHIEGESRNASNPGAPTPFYERLVSDEVQELKEYSRIIKAQDSEIAELKNTNNDMERRLETQTRTINEMETTLEYQENVWTQKCIQLEKDRDEFNKSLIGEQGTNRNLWDLVYQKEREIKRAYQRRYEPSHPGNRRGPQQRSPAERGPLSTNHHHQRIHNERHHGARKQYRGPHDFLEATGSNQTAQERAASRALQDFFGL